MGISVLPHLRLSRSGCSQSPVDLAGPLQSRLRLVYAMHTLCSFLSLLISHVLSYNDFDAVLQNLKIMYVYCSHLCHISRYLFPFMLDALFAALSRTRNRDTTSQPTFTCTSPSSCLPPPLLRNLPLDDPETTQSTKSQTLELLPQTFAKLSLSC